MQNIVTTVKDSKLTIVVDLAKDLGPSKSGKTILIASSQGNQEVIEGVKLGLNVYKYPTQPAS